MKKENDYVKQLITIRIPDVGKDYFRQHPLLGRSDYINDLYMENGVIEITMDAVYEVKTAVKKGFLYVNFLTPRQVYDKVIVIDAGHGGGAPGAIKQGIMEKDINLSIVLELKKLLDENDRDIGVYYTRTGDSNPTFEQRAQLGAEALSGAADGTQCPLPPPPAPYNKQASEAPTSAPVWLLFYSPRKIAPIKFEKECQVEKGEKFAVVLRVTTPGSVHPLAAPA